MLTSQAEEMQECVNSAVECWSLGASLEQHFRTRELRAQRGQSKDQQVTTAWAETAHRVRDTGNVMG